MHPDLLAPSPNSAEPRSWPTPSGQALSARQGTDGGQPSVQGCRMVADTHRP
jgi:hypothetical protein